MKLKSLHFMIGVFGTIFLFYIVFPSLLDNRTDNVPDSSQRECVYGMQGDPNGYTDKVSGTVYPPKIYPSLAPVVKKIEFTDSGAFKERCQYTDILNEMICNRDRA